MRRAQEWACFPEAGGRWLGTWLALGAALAALAGSLVLSLGLGLVACPLCLYQRAFVMGVVATLGVGLAFGAGRPGRLSLLALPVAVGGFGVALFHVYLEATGKLECPPGLRGWGSAPQQALAALTLLSVLLLADVVRHRAGATRLAVELLAAVALGAALAAGAVASAPPMPKPPAGPYEKPLDVCRPPYQPA
jgi:disulfide bond formation protein DsbB